MFGQTATRVVKNTTDLTIKLSKIGADHVAFNLQTSDFVYIGFRGRFASRYFELKTPNATGSVVSLSYWDGDAWTDVDDLVDETIGFTQSGFVHWVNKDDWEPRAITGVDDDIEMYWVRLAVSVNLDSGTELYSVSNVFSDDNLLQIYYPEIVTDSRFLPSGQTNFLAQHVAAKNEVILRLKQRKLIRSEEQIIDASYVAVAATHCAAKIILAPTVTNDAMSEIYRRAVSSFDKEISETNFAVDVNEDGLVESAEVKNIQSTWVSRR